MHLPVNPLAFERPGIPARVPFHGYGSAEVGSGIELVLTVSLARSA